MSRILKQSLLLFFLMFSPRIMAEEVVKQAQWAITYNALETAAFVAINKIFVARVEPKLIYLPFHFDGQARINDSLGLSFGLVYRYESYQDDGPLYSESGKLRAKKVWTGYHEIFLLAGPRFSLQDTGLQGFYVSMKGGVGFAFSPVYFNASFLVQPEIGYAFVFDNPGFHLDLGLGILGNVPLVESKDFAVPWVAKRDKYTVIGTLVHQAIPIVNVGLGYNL